MSDQRIPAGTYKGRGVEGSIQIGQTTNGNDQMILDVHLTEVGETVPIFLYFTESSAPWSIKRLRALGWTGDDLSAVTGIDTNEVNVQVKYEMYNNKMRMKAEIVVPGGSFKLENAYDDKAKRAFAARFANLVKSTAPVSANSRPKADEIPF